jgi:branched-chain amino acid aminotransferase
MASTWINGRFIDEDDASIPLSDAGLLYAAGVFTTMRSFGGRVYRLSHHLARLRASCEALFIPLQYKDDDLAVAVDELLDRNDLGDARLRLTVTRGTSSQDPIHGQHLQPNVFLTATALTPYPPEFYQRGITATVVDDQKLNPYDLQAGHKTVNYFSRLAALRAANKLGAAEALWFNVHNYLQSGSITNVFIIKNSQLRTPPTPAELRDKAVAESIPYPKSNVLPGTTRHAVLTLAAQNRIDTRLTALTITDLLEADEVFITNSNMLLMPVTKVENKPIGTGEPGPLTRQLLTLLESDIASATR